MATAMSVIIPGCDDFSSPMRPFRNGYPPYAKMKEERTKRT